MYKLSVLQKNMKIALAKLKDCVSHEPPLPVLGCVLLSIPADDNTLTLTTTNLEEFASSHTTCRNESDSPFGVAVPYKLLSELICVLPAERIDMTLDNQQPILTLECGRAKANIKCISANEFPSIVDPLADADCISLGTLCQVKALKAMIAYGALALAHTDDRPILTGYHLVCNGQILLIETADGYRIHQASLDTYDSLQPFDVILPGSLADTAKHWHDDKSLTLYHNAKQKCFYMVGDHGISAIHTIDGIFPVTSEIVPQVYGQTLTSKGDSLITYTATLRKLKAESVKFDYDTIIAQADYGSIDSTAKFADLLSGGILDDYPDGISLKVAQLDSALTGLTKLFNGLSVRPAKRAKGKRHENDILREIPSHVLKFGITDDKPVTIKLQHLEALPVSAIAVLMPMRERTYTLSFEEKQRIEDSKQQADQQAAQSEYYDWLRDNGIKGRAKPYYSPYNIEAYYSVLYDIPEYKQRKTFDAANIRAVLEVLSQDYICITPRDGWKSLDVKLDYNPTDSLNWLVAQGFAYTDQLGKRAHSKFWALTEAGRVWARAEHVIPANTESPKVTAQTVTKNEHSIAVPESADPYRLALAWLYCGGAIDTEGTWYREIDGQWVRTNGYTDPVTLTRLISRRMAQRHTVPFGFYQKTATCKQGYSDTKIYELYRDNVTSS